MATQPMAEQPQVMAGVLSDTPDELRARIVSGMRWTLWLSILAVPFSYGTSILLARVGPEAIGTYGLLSVYISLISVFFFLGGPAVAMKFLPEISVDNRFAFLASYFLVICASMLPYQLAASLWPSKLRYLFGGSGGPAFQVFLLWIAPVYVLFTLALAGLKGEMEIGFAQIVARTVTFGSFAIYAVLFIGARRFLADHYTGLIWGVYLSLVICATSVALSRLFRLNRWKADTGPKRFFVPRGFWRYVVGLQASSVAGFLSTRLDYILILNAGGLAVLGEYVALMTLVSAVPMFGAFVLDSFLPSITNRLAQRDLESSRRIAELYLRFMLPSGLGAATFAVLFAHPLVRLLGSRYEGLVILLALAVPFGALQLLNWFTGIMLSAVGQPGLDAVAKVVRTVVFCVSFWFLWERLHLLGAMLAWGFAELAYQYLSLCLLFRKLPFRLSLFRTYAPFVAVVSASALGRALIRPPSLVLSSALWAGLIAAFLALAGYRRDEMRGLVRLMLPYGPRARPAPSRGAAWSGVL